MRGFGPEDLLDCYRLGVFPMADSRDDPRVFLVDPEERGVIPLDRFRVSRSLRKVIRQDVFDVRCDTAFLEVIEACAAPGPGRRNTWINARIFNLYGALHEMGHAHSIECWRDGALVGGLYGVNLLAAFFGESMFSRADNASKVALAHLVARLRRQGYRLLDAQFISDHLLQFGAEAIDRDEFQRRLAEAMAVDAQFGAPSDGLSGDQVLQEITQTS
jgi:leucyl/phenylalanyl-tRNA---protein transferase